MAYIIIDVEYRLALDPRESVILAMRRDIGPILLERGMLVAAGSPRAVTVDTFREECPGEPGVVIPSLKMKENASFG